MDQDAIDIFVSVKALDGRDDLVFGCGFVKKTNFSTEADAFTILLFKPDVYLGRRVVAHQNNG